jgi:hypothetical protein
MAFAAFLNNHGGKITVALIGPALAFGVWAADSFVTQRVESKVQVLDKRLVEIEKHLASIEQQLKDFKVIP